MLAHLVVFTIQRSFCCCEGNISPLTYESFDHFGGGVLLVPVYIESFGADRVEHETITQDNN